MLGWASLLRSSFFWYIISLKTAAKETRVGEEFPEASKISSFPTSFFDFSVLFFFDIAKMELKETVKFPDPLEFPGT